MYTRISASIVYALALLSLPGFVPAGYAAGDLGIEMPTVDPQDIIDADPWGDGGVNELKITVNGIATTRGLLRVFAYDDKQAFDTGDVESAVGYAETTATAGSVVLQVPVFGSGRYAVFVFHDENADAKLNVEDGRPQEGYGLSGGLDPYSRTQNFERAAIVTDAARIRMVYLTNAFK